MKIAVRFLSSGATTLEVLNLAPSRCKFQRTWYNISESYAWGGNKMVQGAYVKNDYVAIIASADDVESVEELVEMVKGGQRPAHSGLYRFELESDTPELVTLVGRGYFFENDWSSDHTVSWIGPESEVRDAKA
jgi:hypothetical protein